MQHEHEEAVLEQLQHDFYTEFGWLGPLSLARTSTCVHAQRISEACLASAAAQLWVRAHLKNSLVRPGTELFSRNATLLALRLADLGRRDAKRHRRFEMTQLVPFVREVEYTFVQI